MSAGGFGLMNKLGYAAPSSGTGTGIEAMLNSPFYKAMLESVCFCCGLRFFTI